MKLNVFGRIVEVLRENGEWVFYSVGDGRKRREDIAIPTDLSEPEVVTYVADIFHEFATPENNEIKILK